MSIDRSLKVTSGLSKHRNVLSRAERMERLAAKSKFDMEADDPLGLPKVAHRKVAAGGKAAKKQAEAEEAAVEDTAENSGQ